MPEDGQAWRQTLAALDEDAHAGHGERFHRLSWRATGRTRPSGARRRHVARTPPHRGCGACGPATPAPRSTPTRGRGTRSALVAPRTPRGYKTLGHQQERRVGDRRQPQCRPCARSPSAVERAKRASRTNQWHGPTRRLMNRFSDTTFGPGTNQPGWFPTAMIAPTTGYEPDMRRYADDDEVDLVDRRLRGRRGNPSAASGAGRLACRRPRRRPVLGSGRRLGQRRSRARTACTGPSHG